MASSIPSSQSEMLSWFEAHAPVWIENATAIGLTSLQASTLNAMAGAGRSAFDFAQTKNQEKLAAFDAKNESLSTLRSYGSEMVKLIRAFAESTNNPVVYQTAQIPQPAAPVPQPPENPYNITFELLTTGQLQLRWKGSSNGGSTSYSVSRAVQTEPGGAFGAPQTIAIVGEKTFIDAGVPSCTIAATYVITAHKGVFTSPGSVPATARFAPVESSDPGLRMVA